jgi:hypothetical protein
MQVQYKTFSDLQSHPWVIKVNEFNMKRKEEMRHGVSLLDVASDYFSVLFFNQRYRSEMKDYDQHVKRLQNMTTSL